MALLSVGRLSEWFDVEDCVPCTDLAELPPSSVPVETPITSHMGAIAPRRDGGAITPGTIGGHLPCTFSVCSHCRPLRRARVQLQLPRTSLLFTILNRHAGGRLKVRSGAEQRGLRL